MIPLAPIFHPSRTNHNYLFLFNSSRVPMIYKHLFLIHNLIHLICWITFIIDSNFIFYLLHNYISLYECIIGNEPSLVDRLSVGNVFSSKLELWNIVFQTKKIFFSITESVWTFDSFDSVAPWCWCWCVRLV